MDGVIGTEFQVGDRVRIEGTVTCVDAARIFSFLVRALGFSTGRMPYDHRVKEKAKSSKTS